MSFRKSTSSLITAVVALSLSGLAAACGDGQESAATTGSGGSGGSTTGSGGANACDPGPQEIPSKQKVDVEINNTTAVDKFLLTKCNECEDIVVEQKGDLDYVELPTILTAMETCGCECPPPAAVYPLGYHRIAAGMSFTATWDARTLAPCTYEEDCGGGMKASKTVGALQPAPEGDYRVSFGIADKVPVDCAQVGGTDDYMCMQPSMPDPDPGGAFVPVEFTLPAMGDVSTKITLQ